MGLKPKLKEQLFVHPSETVNISDHDSVFTDIINDINEKLKQPWSLHQNSREFNFSYKKKKIVKRVARALKKSGWKVKTRKVVYSSMLQNYGLTITVDKPDRFM